MTGCDVLLVCMPFADVFAPSIGLSLLKAELAAEGISARVFYPSIRFAELVGQHFYYSLSVDCRPPLLQLAGEWIFSRALFGARRKSEAYVADILRNRATRFSSLSAAPASPARITRILRARQEVPGFLAACQDEILQLQPRVVGFSSVFQQHVASLALARRLKQSMPHAFVVFGGGNCTDVMGAETVRQFHFVDAAVSGEADLVFPQLVRRVLEAGPRSGLPGVRTRDGLEAELASGRLSDGAMVPDLDALPYPDYGDYFQQFRHSRYGADWRPRIFVETSRGCWWGARSHCTFCGLNQRTLHFRSKSARRAIDEIAWLARRHRGCAVQATDSILDPKYFDEVLPQLARRPGRVRLSYEVKSNLSKRQVGLLREARIRTVQPGIESLSDPVLRLMGKGVTALQNVQLLKWCKELGIVPSWNLLWGFPGEPQEEYARMAKRVPLLAHLFPPAGYGQIRLDRFSPNFEQAEKLGFVDVKPVPAYAYIYPLSGEALDRIACFFSFGYREPRDVAEYVEPLEGRLREWRRSFTRQDLFSVDRGEWLLLWDLRRGGRTPLTVLRGVDKLLYQACDTASDAQRLAELSDGISADEVARRLEPLLQRGLMIRDGSRYLALAVPLGRYSPPPPAVKRFYAVVKAVGRRVRGRWAVSPRWEFADVRRVRRALDGGPSTARARVPPPIGRLSVSQFSVSRRGEVRIRRVPTR